MHAGNCSCGFAATSPDELGDHLREVFTPDDDTDASGQRHAEAAGDNWACLCGFAADGIASLDAHLLEAFRPSDAIGHDGIVHVAGDPRYGVRGTDRPVPLQGDPYRGCPGEAWATAACRERPVIRSFRANGAPSSS